jgi:phage-related protein
MADLTVNQYGIGASGEQAAQASNMMAKAMNGQFGVLEKSGIRFTEAQQHAINFGTEMEKVTAINEGFAQNLKFTNEVALGTFEGAMANLNNRFGDFKENLGAAVIPMITALGGVLGQVVTWLENMDPSVRDAIAQGIAFAGAFAAVAGAAMLLIAAINPVTIAIVAVGAAFALWKLYGDDIIKYLQGWGIDLGAIWEGIKKAVFDAWNWIVTNIIPVVSKFIEDMKARITPMIQFITDHWAEITTVLQSAWNTITMLWSVFWEGVQLIFTTAWELFAGALKTGLSIIQGDWNGAWTAIKEMFGGIWNGIVTFFKGIWNTITKFLDDQLKQVGSSFDEMSKTVTATWSGFWNGLKNIVDGIVGEITKIINNIISTVKGAIEYINQLINLATKAGSAVASDIGSRLTYTGSPGSQFNHNAIGGRQNAGSPTVVGEKGREIFVPSTSGRIIPNNEIGGGNKTINISLNFNGPVSTKEVALEYMDIAIRELQLHSQVI